MLRVIAQYDRQTQELLDRFRKLHAKAIGIEAIALAESARQNGGSILTADAQGRQNSRSGRRQQGDQAGQRTAGFRPGDVAPQVSQDRAAANAEDKPAEEQQPLFGTFKEILGTKVAQVRASKRLKDSPACLVVPDGGLPPHIERMLRARQGDLPVTARILEVNAEHPLLRALGDLRAKHPDSPKIKNFVELIYDQALLAEGSPIEDPARFAQRLSEVLVTAASVELSQS